MEEATALLTVTQVNMLARNLLEQVSVYVVGEVDEYEDGYKHAVYFKLKDGESTLPGIFWKSEDVGYYPKNGERVIAQGYLTLYEKSGKYQLKVQRIEVFGEGDLLKKREELRKKLTALGYFSEETKRPIPELPVKIGLITSKRGAALNDFLTNVVKGFEGLEIYLVDTLVQGEAAVKSICESLKFVSSLRLDVVVLTRGGGDMEDLMCFNTAEVVKAIRDCPIPVISAVGHEVDYTLSDLAADLRVSTPTKAAELIASAYVSYKLNLTNSFLNLHRSYERIEASLKQELDLSESTLKMTWNNFKTYPLLMEDLKARVGVSAQKLIAYKEFSLKSLSEKLEALNPSKVLKRGYSITYDSAGALLKSVALVNEGEKITTLVGDGKIVSIVEAKE
ncbi:exodeoxyribonuclease VII large subunit [candidate division WWE3 bacterium]|nr:exodeoxyribonuclease VII large subunit [candidate division WWE3 bacterium]